jgi:ATP-dependent RNA helicase DDX46/PRP5
MLDFFDDHGQVAKQGNNPSWFEASALSADKNKLRKLLEKVDHSKIQYEVIRKNFFVESAEITRMTEEQVKEFREVELEGVKVRPAKKCPRPIKKWTQCGLPEKVYDVLKRQGFERPFSIQAQALPAIMSGHDVIACAKTGSGKTLAFVLPMIRHVMDQRPIEEGEGPIGLVLTPTRELAVQIQREVKLFAHACRVRSVCVYGGAAIADQIAELKRGAEIIVATPGRMIDMYICFETSLTLAFLVTRMIDLFVCCLTLTLFQILYNS